VNAYLLDTDDGRCLIDCGSRLDPGWEFIEHALSLAGAKPDEIALLVTTHHHSDHAGQAERVLHETGAEYLHFDGPPPLHAAPRGWLLSADLILRTLAPFLEWGVMEDPYAVHLAALERARMLAPRLLLPGHGRPVVGVEDQLRFAVRAVEGLSDGALALLEGA